MLPKGPYDPHKYEPEILKWWLQSKFYKPEYDPKSNRLLSLEELKKDKTPTYCIIIPPPNAYGRPHMGNVSAFAYEDLFLRFYRQLGYRVYGQPGKDHAGIQGEIVVLREHFRPQGKSKQNMTREEFYKETYRYFQTQIPLIREVEKRIGLSADFDRDTFTLDPDIVKLVLETFIKLWEDGLVYKGVRIVNWCPSCKTALADVDTEKKERESRFYYIKYPLLEKEQKVWEMRLPYRTILAIKKGIKQIEIRPLGPDKKHQARRNIKPGDIIIFQALEKEHHSYRLPVVVKKVNIYSNLEEIYKNEDQSKISSDGKKRSFREWVKAWKDGYEKVYLNIEKHGAVAIYIEPYNPKFYTKHFITVATTRPETMLGDTAVVVNPKDKRYKHLIGRKVLLPLVWREIPIIADGRVDMELGTGALKLTPAHAPEDYEIMLTWNKENPKEQVDYINVIDKDGSIVGPTGQFFGLNVEEAREKVVEELKKLNLIEKIETKSQIIRVCERCKTPIEPLMSSQWFIKIDALRKPAIEVVRKGKIKIYPKNMTKKYFHWMENLRDWPISRSLWWGYRFPVWYKGKPEEFVDENGKIVTKIGDTVVRDIHEAVKKGLAVVSLKKPEGDGWIQDDNVFDTWFSSGQWPFVTLMKWDLFDKFYPTDLMETGYDILEWWVSRMIMLGLYRTGKIPFKEVYLHGLILAEDGQKMSKSKGNVVYPDEVINEYGADALRLFYFTGAKAGAGMPLERSKLEGNRRFLNKLWNIAKFVLMNIEDVYNEIPTWSEKDVQLKDEDKKMLKEVKTMAQKRIEAFKNYTFGSFIIDLRTSVWNTFADWYIESVKPRLYNKEGSQDKDRESRKAAQYTLYNVLRTYLILLHPFIPFITDRIWQEMPKRKGDHESLMFVKD